MSSNNSHNRRREEGSFLSRIDINELKTIRVAIKRNNITCSGPPAPIQRSLGDPKDLRIHFREDEGLCPIFQRDDVIVNQKEEHSEKRLIVAEVQQNDTAESFTTKSYSRSKSRTPPDKNYHPTKDKSRETYQNQSKSPLKPIEYRPSREKDSDRHRNRSRTPLRPGEYRPSREKEYEKYRQRRSRSPLKPGEYRPSREKEYERYKRRSGSLLRPGEYRPYRRSKSPRDYGRKSRSLSQERFKRATKRKSPSPDLYKPSTSRKYSRSPPRKSPYRSKDDRQHSLSRYSGESSRTVADRSMKPDKNYKESSRYHERKSRSPSRHEVRRRSGSPRDAYRSHADRRSSPGRYETEYRRRSRSPSRYERHRGEKRRSSSRSPGRLYKKPRSRSRSSRKSRSPYPDHGLMERYPYFQGHEFWIPGPIPRVYPGPFPRGMPPVIIPRMPMMMPYPPYRPRLPVYNNRQIKKIENIQATPTSADGASTSKVHDDVSTSTGNVLISEVGTSGEAENVATTAEELDRVIVGQAQQLEDVNKSSNLTD